jgi:hypothetical protein
MANGNPVQVICDSVYAKPERSTEWDRGNIYRVKESVGRLTKYILEMNHPTIGLSRIVDGVAMLAYGACIHSFTGSSLIIYNKLYHPKYLAAGLLVIPFMPIGNADRLQIGVDHVDLYVKTQDHREESNGIYLSMVRRMLCKRLIPDIAHVVLGYLQFTKDIPNELSIKIKVHVETHFPTYGDRTKVSSEVVLRPQIRPSIYITEHRFIRDPARLIEYKIDVVRPINQICVAFWAPNTFPRFLPCLESMTLRIGMNHGIHAIESDPKKSIYDKLHHNIEVDQRNPIYTITFANPLALVSSDSSAHADGLLDHSELDVAKQLVPGTLLGAIRSSMLLQITARDIDIEIVVGVWTIETKCLRFRNVTQAPEDYSFVKEFPPRFSGSI